MLRYIGGRLALAVPTLFGAATLVFVVIRLLPGDPARVLAGSDAGEAELARLRHQLGTDQPIPIQYLAFLGGILRGDLGSSITTQQTVVHEIAARLPYTLELAVISITIATLLGVSAGIVAAIHHGTIVDLVVSALAVLGVSLPVFWLGLMLVVLLAINVRLFPSGGIDGTFAWVLPSMTLALVVMGVIARMTRSSMLDVLGQDYIRTAQSKGASPRQVMIGHALRNALLPTVTVIGLQFGHLLGGAVLTEIVFSWPGIGRLLVDSILARDYPVIQALVLTFSAFFILVNLAVDIGYAYLDPRIRYD